MSATPACVFPDRRPAPRPRRYRARRPETTPLYEVVQHHFETWLALKRTGEAWEDTVPAFVERDFLQREPAAVNAVLHIFLRSIEQTLRAHSPGVGPRARLGAVSFLHRFGSALNPHVHFHCCVLDGVFEAEPASDGQVRFSEALGLSAQEVAAVQAQVRRRVLRWFVRRGWLEETDRRQMQRWAHSGGFSVDAVVRIEAWDRDGLERLLRYCARPPFALERLQAAGADRLIYHLPKPGPDRRTELTLTPLELIDRLAALIPPPRLHRHRYHGVLAPNAPLRAAVTALARAPAATPSHPASTAPVGSEGRWRSPARYLWAMLIARIYEGFPLVCTHCGNEMRIISFVTDTASVTRILEHIGEPTKTPVLSPARGPPAGETFDQTPVFDPVAPAPAPAFEFDQTVTW